MITNQEHPADGRGQHKRAADPSDHASPVSRLVRPEFRSISDTMAVLGFRSRTSIYELAREGLLDMRKVMGKSLVTQASIDRLVADAPRASASPEQSAA